jgi:V/A-type H+/Na+-transporting ATPase subunit K
MKVRARTVLFCSGVLLLMLMSTAFAQPEYESADAAPGDTWRTVGLAIAAALTMAVSVLGAGWAVGRIGSAALGAAAEKPELLTRSILFVALAEGLAVLGFAIAMIIAQKI